MSDGVTICECFARDGLQHEAAFVPTATKIALIDAFTACGVSADRGDQLQPSGACSGVSGWGGGSGGDQPGGGGVLQGDVPESTGGGAGLGGSGCGGGGE